MPHDILSGLNDKQQEAVQILNGPVLILAGAGSGKTKCLTHRTGNLILNGVPGQHILAVTFTNKAANEMKERIEKLIAPDIDTAMPSVGTFHSICVRMLRQHIEHLESGFSRQFLIFDTADSQSLMKTILKDQGLNESEIKYRPVLKHISSAKNQLTDIQDYVEEKGIYNTAMGRALIKVSPIYNQKLREHNALDFDDLLQKTVELLETCPTVLEYYRKKWNHLMVDEYQDTNFAQYRLVRLLGDEHQNICVIGDDHQSIYSFRGADYTNILNFEKDFPNAKIIKLEQNYRSTKSILSCANHLIAKNKTGLPKKLWTQNTDGDKIAIIEAQDEKAEGK
jgi:DNA helicase-2/ATP-dependent DNA helicase PcrA